MSTRTFELWSILVGGAFTLAFAIIVVPAVVETGDIVGAFAAGFVNPFASGYALDAICCALILAVWVLYERSRFGVRHGWIAIPLSFAPGVATAFAFYLVLRSRQGASIVP
ncbi:MAG: DUF2834 domain-containing protein [Polyangiales bacterium]